MRSRNNIVTIRMNDDEYAVLKAKVKESGLTQQSFINNAIKGATIASDDEVEILKDLSITFADLVRQLRGLATNINQIAHVANGMRILPLKIELSKTREEIKSYKKECEEIWQLIRSLINQQRHTGQ